MWYNIDMERVEFADSVECCCIVDASISEAIHDNPDKARYFDFVDENVIDQIKKRKQCSDTVCDVLNDLSVVDSLNNIDRLKLSNFYESITGVIRDRDYQRLLLYLPFEIISFSDLDYKDDFLDKSIENFKEAYLGAFVDLLNVHDMRANFVNGDVLEISVRDEDPERVVKVAHLIPWLMKNQVISFESVKRIVQVDDLILRKSIVDTLPALLSFDLISDEDRNFLESIKTYIPVKTPKPPLFISNSRKKWLESKGLNKNSLLIEGQDMRGNFSQNLSFIKSDIENINNKLNQLDSDNIHKVALIGGSRVKGYANQDSDIDICLFVDSNISRYEWEQAYEAFGGHGLFPIYVNSFELAGLIEDYAGDIFNSIWVGDKAEVRIFQNKVLNRYYGENNELTRSNCLEKIESDLLQYRLLHNGYARYHNFEPFSFSDENTMNESSPFYDSGYRRLALEIYLKRVFMPNIRKKTP